MRENVRFLWMVSGVSVQMNCTFYIIENVRSRSHEPYVLDERKRMVLMNETVRFDTDCNAFGVVGLLYFTCICVRY